MCSLPHSFLAKMVAAAFLAAHLPRVAPFCAQTTRLVRPALLRMSSSADTSLPPTAAARLSRGSLTSPDARSIENNLEVILSHLRSRRANDATMELAGTVAQLNSKRVELIKRRDAALNIRKTASAEVGMLMREQKVEEADLAKAKSAAAGSEADAAEEELAVIQGEIDGALAAVPNLLDDRVPEGGDDTENELITAWGSPAEAAAAMGWSDGFEPRWHDDVASALGGWEVQRAVGISGARFAALSGPVARLERALTQFFLDLHTVEHGYTEVSVPLVVGRGALQGTSQLPKFEEDLFKIDAGSHTCNGEDAFLIPTAEVPLTNLHAGEILEEADLPVCYVAATPCFRAEAGASGRDTRGLFRLHQFPKVELVKITSASASDDEHESLTAHAEECLKRLKLPYKKVRLCSGDIGFAARHCYDLEVWLPGQGEYREVSSCSNCGDFQARRMGTRYRPAPVVADDEPKKGGKKKKPKKEKPLLCHTINGSGLAVGRALIAVLENYQREDGAVVVPEALRGYMGGCEVILPVDAGAAGGKGKGKGE